MFEQFLNLADLSYSEKDNLILWFIEELTALREEVKRSAPKADCTGCEGRS